MEMRPQSKIQHQDRSGQSLAEYAILLGVVVVALITMQAYARRGLQARYRTVVDGAMKAIRAPTQYEPYYASAASTDRQDQSVLLDYQPGGAVTRMEREQRIGEGGVERVGASLTADDAWQ